MGPVMVEKAVGNTAADAAAAQDSGRHPASVMTSVNALTTARGDSQGF